MTIGERYASLLILIDPTMDVSWVDNLTDQQAAEGILRIQDILSGKDHPDWQS